MKRQPAVAGQFYESSASGLSRQVDRYIQEHESKEDAVGIVCPHAGLMYSGKVAGAVFSKIRIPDTFIMIGPNHTGYGSPVSLMSSGNWQIPTGQLSIDENLSGKLKEGSGLFVDDAAAHQMEHSLEVQLPFILHFTSRVSIVPITMMPLSLEKCRVLGETIADSIRRTEYPVTILASSDMSHYETESAARKKDKLAIEKIVDLDPEGLYAVVRDNGITMCGVIPVTTMLFAAKSLGAKEASLIQYMTSGEISGDYDYVVGYAGVVVK